MLLLCPPTIADVSNDIQLNVHTLCTTAVIYIIHHTTYGMLYIRPCDIGMYVVGQSCLISCPMQAQLQGLQGGSGVCGLRGSSAYLVPHERFLFCLSWV